MEQLKSLFFICLIFILLIPTPTEVFGHSGRTDSYGGHNKTSNGTYHCHSGPCLDDAWEEAYDTFFPIGQKDGKKRNNRVSIISEDLTNKLDPDIAEYMVLYAIKAYKIGYEDTCILTFWERYRWYIGGGAGITIIGAFALIKSKKGHNSL